VLENVAEKPDSYSSHAYGKNNSTVGVFPANRRKSYPDIPVAEVARISSAIRTPGIPFTIVDGWAVIIAAAPPNIQRQQPIVEINAVLPQRGWSVETKENP
jgi:hypothetical protein